MDAQCNAGVPGVRGSRVNRPPSAGSEQANNPDARKRIAQFIEGLQRMLGSRESQEMGMFDITAKSIDTMQAGITRSKLAAYSPDIVIEIPGNACNFFEFHRARELIGIGRRMAERALAASSNRI